MTIVVVPNADAPKALRGRPEFISDADFADLINASATTAEATKRMEDLFASRKIADPIQGFKSYISQRSAYLRRTKGMEIKTFPKGRALDPEVQARKAREAQEKADRKAARLAAKDAAKVQTVVVEASDPREEARELMAAEKNV